MYNFSIVHILPRIFTVEKEKNKKDFFLNWESRPWKAQTGPWSKLLSQTQQMFNKHCSYFVLVIFSLQARFLAKRIPTKITQCNFDFNLKFFHLTEFLPPVANVLIIYTWKYWIFYVNFYRILSSMVKKSLIITDKIASRYKYFDKISNLC